MSTCGAGDGNRRSLELGEHPAWVGSEWFVSRGNSEVGKETRDQAPTL